MLAAADGPRKTRLRAIIRTNGGATAWPESRAIPGAGRSLVQPKTNHGRPHPGKTLLTAFISADLALEHAAELGES
jgi:hypothetical protein